MQEHGKYEGSLKDPESLIGYEENLNGILTSFFLIMLLILFHRCFYGHDGFP